MCLGLQAFPLPPSSRYLPDLRQPHPGRNRLLSLPFPFPSGCHHLPPGESLGCHPRLKLCCRTLLCCREICESHLGRCQIPGLTGNWSVNATREPKIVKLAIMSQEANTYLNQSQDGHLCRRTLCLLVCRLWLVESSGLARPCWRCRGVLLVLRTWCLLYGSGRMEVA